MKKILFAVLLIPCLMYSQVPILNGDTLVCANGSTTISAQGEPGATFTWYDDEFNQIHTGSSYNITQAIANTLLVNSTLGTFTIYVNQEYPLNSSLNITSPYSSITIEFIALPVVSLHALEPTICLGDSTILIANGADSYTWNNGETGDSIVVSPNSNQNFNVYGTDTNNCISATESITVFVATISNIASKEICLGESTTLSWWG